MELSSLFSLLGDVSFDDVLFWGVAGTAAVVGFAAVVNAIDMFFEAEAG